MLSAIGCSTGLSPTYHQWSGSAISHACLTQCVFLHLSLELCMHLLGNAKYYMAAKDCVRVLAFLGLHALLIYIWNNCVHARACMHTLQANASPFQMAFSTCLQWHLIHRIPDPLSASAHL